ncbi:kinesin-domain-containing protein [Hymenopellis radicata]|nr:kinesin-domain-containing protein [Hymenopellis radicata]
MAPPPSSSATTSVQVAVRIRPPTNQDNTNIPARFQRSVLHASSSTTLAVEATSGAPTNTGPASAASSAAGAAAKKQVFTFDQVHGPPTTQHAMFTSTAHPLISRFVEGFNCTILAYGQTSSGKTHTMTGIDLDADPSDPNNGMGIIPRAVSTIFSRCRQFKEERAGSWTFSIKGSFIEIYNEDLIDLLSLEESGGGRREVQIREDKDGHIIWGGLREVTVKNPNEVMSLIRKGTSIRRTNETDMNAQSSRSHAIFSLTLTQKKFTGSGAPPRSSSPLPPSGRSPSRLARPGSVYQGGPGTSRVASPTFGRPSTPSFAVAMGRGGLRPASALGHSGDPGSERLKRTAAAGERIKEGISINSGLLALGNVISALGDPGRAKSHTATHIPYRDSKLTRLLQDSLGGNAHTLMIACVSAAEYNAGETINTLKYANRARNIKNRAVLNEREDGWDDVEWLQGTVTRGAIPIDAPAAAAAEPVEGAGKKVLAQMTELQNNYEDLREKFVERTEELTRLRRELGEKHRGSSAGAIGGTAKYEEIVGPVIEEYEKTIAAMEAELNLNRAALRHTNEMVEEKEEELSAITERHAATELYVEELRARVAKLTEREASTEAYVRDLEEKMKSYDETSISSSESMTDLKREVARFRDTESHSAKYIVDLEARLARSDESVLALQQTVEKYEKEVERRRDEVELLQSRLETLRQDGEGWRSDLEERERRVRELEEKMAEWQQIRKDAGDARVRLNSVADEVASARRSLEVDLKKDATPTSPEIPIAAQPDPALQQQFLALQETHNATLADLSSVTSKYRDALREISDLAAQIQEAKLSNASEVSVDSPTTERSLDLPTPSPARRRMPSHASLNTMPLGAAFFFRQAASTESLHSRSLSQSQSLSQELSSVHSRKTSSSSHSSSHSRSESNSTSTLNSLLLGTRPNLSISVPNGNSERSVSSLETEIMRLQEVLKERESEIMALEASLKQTQDDRSTASSPAIVTPADGSPETVPAKMNGHHAEEAHLSPKTLSHFNHIRKSMELNHNGHDVVDLGDSESERNDSSVTSDTDESLERLNELMLSMAAKESQHREMVEGLNGQLTQVKRQHDELTALSRDQAVNMSSEMANLRKSYDQDLEALEEMRKHEVELMEALEKVNKDHAAAVEDLRTEHVEALKAKEAELDDLMSRVKEEHEAAVGSLREELVVASATLEQVHRDHEAAFGKLQAGHEEALARRLQEASDILSQTKGEHESAVRKLVAEHEEVLKQKEAEASSVLHKTEEDYYNVLTKLRADHATALEKQAADATATLDRMKEEHAGELRMLEISREGSLSESHSSQMVALQNLQEEHTAATSRKEAAFAEQLERLKSEHSRVLSTKEEDLTLQLDRVRSEHEGVLMRLKEEWRVEGERLNATVIAAKEEAASAASANNANAKSELEAAIQQAKEQHAAVLEDMGRCNDEEIAQLKDAHSAALKASIEDSEAKLLALTQTHTEETARLKAEHQQAVADLNTTIVAMQEEHHSALEQARLRGEQALAAEKETVTALLEDLKRQNETELSTLRKDHELLVGEVEAHKIATDEWSFSREQTRENHEQAAAESSRTITGLQEQVVTFENERDELAVEVARLRAELDNFRNEQSKLIQEASKRESLVGELERHRSVLAEMQDNLQKVKDEKDTLQVEKSRSDTLLRELQAQLSRSASPPNGRPTPDRSISYSRANGMSPMKLPPPTPPPSVPPPPAPRDVGASISSTTSSGMGSSTSSRESQVDSPSTSVAPGSVLTGSAPDLKKIEAQAKLLDEQEAMIKTLNKQLTHCESDLQTHMDLVSTLETSLGDSEKNLRKARMHATELARERDTLNTKLEGLRNELAETKREVVNVRKSIVEEKQSYEQKLDEERRAKERARQQLDSRMDELTSKRKSKFACL